MSKIVISRRELLKSSMALLAGMRVAGWSAAQTERKRLYIALDDHTDYMWSGDEETYREAFLDMLDYYLDLADETQDNPPEHQSRWNCDGYFWLWTYEQNKSASDFERLIERIRDGHITVPLNALVVCLGGAPAEAVLRGMYYPGKIERRYELRFPLAISMENQTLPYGLVSLWAGSGAQYSWKGICGCVSRAPVFEPRDHEIYWWEGPDGSRILMKWYSLIGDKISLGGYAEARDAAEAVEALDEFAPSDRYPYRIAGAFGKGWDDLSTITDEFVTVAQDTTNDERLVVVSNETDFFEDFLGTYGDDLPTVAASYGNEWELYCTSMAEVSASVKRSVEKLRTAEALATLVSLHKPDFMAGREEARDRAWLNLGLYWEHDWTADGSISRNDRGDWQRRIAGEIAGYVDELYGDATMALAGMIQMQASGRRFYVFNPLNWARTDYADFAYADLTAIHVVDASTGEEVPSQQVVVNNRPYLRILAQDVPPLGYRVYEIRQGEGEAFSDAADFSDTVIENDFYRITVAPRGAITSLIDKTRDNREFVQVFDDLALNDLAQGSGTLRVENQGPVSVTLLAEVEAPVRHTKRITLVRGSNRIELRNEILENFSDVLTWHFGFNLDEPDVWHEEVGAIIRARLLDEGGHYATSHARYDWLTLNHFADMSGDDDRVGVTLSNADCYYFQLGNSSVEVLDTRTPRLSVLAGGQVDGTDLGIHNQGGDSYFLQRFALQTRDAYDPVAAMRFALEHQNPLVAAPVIGGDIYPETSYSFAQLDHPLLVLWALKPAEEGTGIITRLWNLSSQAADFSLSLTPGPISSASQTTHIETVIGDATTGAGALSESISAHQLKTYLLRLTE